MAIATTQTVTGSANDMPALARKFHEQLISTVQQSQQLSIDAAQTWVKAVSVLPMVDLPKLTGIPAMPGLDAATRYTFDVAADLLSLQREFALQLTNTLTPPKAT